MTLAAEKYPAVPSDGARLFTNDGTRDLPLRATRLRARACGGFARVTLEQQFANPWNEPLVVTYALPLPHDGAVSGFAFNIGSRRVVGEVDTLEEARSRFEQAMVEGRSAGLLEQERGSLFTQQLGNIPPGEDIVAEITIDQPLAWLDGGAWEWRFPLVVAPRYLGGAGRVPDADRLVQDVTTADDGPELGFEIAIADTLSGNGTPWSPSHDVRARESDGTWAVVLDTKQADTLDRDVVVRWPVARENSHLALDAARAMPDRRLADEAAYGILSITPPAEIGASQVVPRDLVLLIDTSGSMSGPPLEQAKAVATAVVETLGDRDHLEMVEFSSRPRRWRASPEPATREMVRQAKDWLAKLSACGGTEMVSGLWEALRPRRLGAQRQVVLITDGLVGFESDVVRTIRDALPQGSRVHSVGVGSASNRSLTAPSARAGRGVEVQAGSGGEREAAIEKLLSRLAAPLVTDLVIAGDAVVDLAPRALPDLYAGAPLRVAAKLRPEGGHVVVSGQTPAGAWQHEIVVAPIGIAAGSDSFAKCYARELVEDLEVDLAAGGSRSEIDARIRQIGCDFQIATRLTAWVAVAEEPVVDPREPFRRVRQPQQLPYGLSAEGLGLPSFWSPNGGAEMVLSLDSPLGSASLPRMGSRSLETIDLPDLYLDSESPEMEPRQRPPRVRLVARLATRKGDAWTFVIDVVAGDFEWQLPERVEVLWSNDRAWAVSVLEEQTTAPGPVSAGATVRLVLQLPADTPQGQPERLVLTSVLYGKRRIKVEG